MNELEKTWDTFRKTTEKLLILSQDLMLSLVINNIVSKGLSVHLCTIRNNAYSHVEGTGLSVVDNDGSPVLIFR